MVLKINDIRNDVKRKEKIMTTSYKEKSIALVTSLEKEIAAMAIASESKQNALKTIQEFLDLRHSKEEVKLW